MVSLFDIAMQASGGLHRLIQLVSATAAAAGSHVVYRCWNE